MLKGHTVTLQSNCHNANLNSAVLNMGSVAPWEGVEEFQGRRELKKNINEK